MEWGGQAALSSRRQPLPPNNPPTRAPASIHPPTTHARPQYARQRYGGMCAYMESIGFSKEEQARLRVALTVAEW